MKNSRRDINVSYSNVLEAFELFKGMGSGGTEVDLAYVPRIIQGGRYSDCTFILNPYQHVTSEQRVEIVEYGMIQMQEGNIKNLTIH